MNKLCFLKDRLRFYHLPLVRWPHSRYSEGFEPKMKTSNSPYHDYWNQEALEFKIIFGILTSSVHLEHSLSVNDINLFENLRKSLFQLNNIGTFRLYWKKIGPNWHRTWAATHTGYHVKMLLCATKISGQVLHAKRVSLTGVHPLLVLHGVRNSVKKDPEGLPHSFLTNC